MRFLKISNEDVAVIVVKKGANFKWGLYNKQFL